MNPDSLVAYRGSFVGWAHPCLPAGRLNAVKDLDELIVFNTIFDILYLNTTYETNDYTANNSLLVENSRA